MTPQTLVQVKEEGGFLNVWLNNVLGQNIRGGDSCVWLSPQLEKNSALL